MGKEASTNAITFKGRASIAMAMRKLPKTLDLADMKSMVSHFAQMLTLTDIDPEIIERAREFNEQGIEGLCFLGMGGSAIVGNYVREVLCHEALIPICIERDYDLPRYVTKDWATIAVSYSGNTEETLSALKQANERGSKILTITSGGQMKTDYDRHPQIFIQRGLQPRAALPLLFSAALRASQSLTGLTPTEFDEIAMDLTAAAEKWGEWIPSPSATAGKIRGKIPLFIGARYLRPVAYRAKCQVNENSKMMAFSLEMPEATHNEIEGFQSRQQDYILPVFLRQEGEAVQVKRQLDAVVDLCNDLNMNPVSLKASGSSIVEKMLILTHYLDMLSVELAELQGVDALGVERITELKKRTAPRN